MKEAVTPRARLFVVANPCGPITFRATVGEAAVIGDILVKGLMFVTDASTGKSPAVSDVLSTRARMVADPDARASVADALDTFLYASPATRPTYEAEVRRLPPLERVAFMRDWHRRHRPARGTDVCLQMYRTARQLRASPRVHGKGAT